jgi:bifunctional UDP-N-acetylglucosamine pyrophosphorylase/glucosamine-1-phosphate N-acetyltransferase
LKAVVLAGGMGKRLKSSTPKPLVKLFGKEIVWYVYDNVISVGRIEKVIVVVSPFIEKEVKRILKDAVVLIQKKPLGTAHALHTATEVLEPSEDILVMYSDTPLIRPRTIDSMIKHHLSSGNDITFLSGLSKKVYPYAVVMRDKEGSIIDVEEHAAPDGDPPWEYSIGSYIFKVEVFEKIYKDLEPRETGEVYIPDAIKLALKRGYRVGAYICEDEREYLGINTPDDLRKAEKILREFYREGMKSDESASHKSEG